MDAEATTTQELLDQLHAQEAEQLAVLERLTVTHGEIHTRPDPGATKIEKQTIREQLVAAEKALATTRTQISMLAAGGETPPPQIIGGE